MSELQQFALTVISSAGVSVALSGAAVWIAREWIGERLRSSIRHEYDQRLAMLNAELRTQGDAQLASLKAELDKQAEKLRIVSSSFTEVQKASIVRKLEAIDALWSGILSARAMVPPIMAFMDILTEDEYVSANTHPTFRSLTGTLDQAAILKLATDSRGSLERTRPYVGEYVWALFASFQSVMVRSVLLVQLGKHEAEKLNWHQDSLLRQLVTSALGADGLRKFDQTKIGKIGWLREEFERQILSAMETLITGKDFGEAALRQAQQMEEQIRKAANEQPGG